MKNKYTIKFQLLALLLVATITAFAQHDTIPNHGFENWTCPSYCDPNSWETPNSLTYLGGIGSAVVFKETTGAYVHGGAASAKLETASVFGNEAPGTVTTGAIDETTEAINGGCAMNYRPYRFKGWFQYAPSGTDTFVASLALYTGNTYGTPIGTANFYTTSTVSTWTQFDLLINYTGPGTPDTMQIIIASGTGNNSHTGSIAYVDDLSLVDCSLLLLSTTPTAASCTQSDGSAVAVASGGAGPYSYVWSNSTTNATLTGVPAGTFTVAATDTNGCSATASAVISSNNVPFTVTATSTASSCLSNTGTVTAIGSAGTSPYTYVWNNTDTSHVVANLGPGSYQVTVTDANGCSTTGSAAVTTASGPSVTDSTTGPLCNGESTGSVTISVTGGTSPITYIWNNTDTTQNLGDVSAGTYSVTVTDANSCSFTISATVNQPAAIAVTTAQLTNVACNGYASGSINLTVTGGVGPYTYAWYCCAGNSLGGGNPKAALAAGDYNVFITDSNGCSFEAFDTITEPLALNVQTTATVASSQTDSDGTASVTISGGTSPYSVFWSDSATVGNITNLAPGTYSITVTDSAGCTAIDSAKVGVATGINNINMPAARLYPNPANTQVLIEMGANNNKCLFSLYSADGKLVKEENITGSSTSVDLQPFSAGLYTYRVRDLVTGGLQYGKLVIER